MLRVAPKAILLLTLLHYPQASRADCLPPPSGLLSWWPGEGNALDELGGNTGTLAGDATFGPGKVGHGFAFDGNSGNAIQVGNATNLQLQDFTVEAWVSRSSTSMVTTYWTGIGFIFSFGFGGYGLGLNNSGDLVLGKVGVSSVLAGVSISDTSFHHVAVTKSGGAVVFYLDGVAYSAAAYNPGFYFNAPAAIGAQGNDLTSAFFGTIDEVSVYSRALAAGEIQNIYVAGSFGKCAGTFPPLIVSQPTNETVFVSEGAMFSVLASGSAPLGYQWSFNGTPIASATKSTLALTNVQLYQEGGYSVSVTNVVGTNSAGAFLTVNPAPPCAAPPSGVVSWWRGEGATADEVGGNNGTLAGNAAFGVGEVGVAFVFDGNSGNAVQVGDAANLQLQDLTVEAWVKRSSTSVVTAYGTGIGFIFSFGVGGYGFALNNSGQLVLGKVGASSVSAGVSISDTSFHHVAVTKSGGTVVFYLDGVAYSAAAYDPGFYFNAPAAIGAQGNDLTSAFFGTIDEVSVYNRALSVGEVQAIYSAQLSGKCVTPAAPSIVFQPQGQTVLVGRGVTFTVAARGSPPVTYQWQFNGTNLAGATGYSLTLTNVQFTNAGNYSVAITNSVGWASSSNATLRVKAVFAYGNNQQFTNSQYTFNGQVTIQLQNAFAGGPVFYTLDGSIPTFSSQQYSTPFVLKRDAILRAVSYSTDFFQTGESDPVSIVVVPYYTLSATTAGGGSVALSPPGGTYLSNTVVNLTATPSSGWTFLQWLGDASGANPATNLTMARNMSMQAVFGTTLSTTAAGGGSVLLNPAGGLYPYGTTVQITAIPQPGNYFGIWGNAASGNTNPLSFVVRTANPTVSSLFGALSGSQVALTVVPVGNGRIAVSPRTNVFNVGAAVSITATPDSGQSFGGWSGDTNGTHNPLALTMDQSKVIYANFTTRPSLSVRSAFEGLKPEGFRMTLSGLFGAQYEIDASSDLINWTPLATLTNTYGAVQFTDAAATNLLHRFYRSSLLP